jgi:hypothetical protein
VLSLGAFLIMLRHLFAWIFFLSIISAAEFGFRIVNHQDIGTEPILIVGSLKLGYPQHVVYALQDIARSCLAQSNQSYFDIPEPKTASYNTSTEGFIVYAKGEVPSFLTKFMAAIKNSDDRRLFSKSVVFYPEPYLTTASPNKLKWPLRVNLGEVTVRSGRSNLEKRLFESSSPKPSMVSLIDSNDMLDMPLLEMTLENDPKPRRLVRKICGCIFW